MSEGESTDGQSGNGEKDSQRENGEQPQVPDQRNDYPPTYDPSAMDPKIFDAIARAIEDEKLQPIPPGKSVPNISPATSLLDKLPPKRANPHGLHIVKKPEANSDSSGSQNPKPPSPDK